MRPLVIDCCSLQHVWDSDTHHAARADSCAEPNDVLCWGWSAQDEEATEARGVFDSRASPSTVSFRAEAGNATLNLYFAPRVSVKWEMSRDTETQADATHVCVVTVKNKHHT